MISNYSALTNDIVVAVGGKENIVSVTNCMTRLRFVLKDDNLPKDEEVKELLGVAGVVKQGGEYQIVIGPEVVNLLPFVRKEMGLSLEEEIISSDKVDESEKLQLKNNIGNNKKSYVSYIAILSLLILCATTFCVMKRKTYNEKKWRR